MTKVRTSTSIFFLPSKHLSGFAILDWFCLKNDPFQKKVSIWRCSVFFLATNSSFTDIKWLIKGIGNLNVWCVNLNEDRRLFHFQCRSRKAAETWQRIFPPSLFSLFCAGNIREDLLCNKNSLKPSFSLCYIYDFSRERGRNVWKIHWNLVLF